MAESKTPELDLTTVDGSVEQSGCLGIESSYSHVCLGFAHAASSEAANFLLFRSKRSMRKVSGRSRKKCCDPLPTRHNPDGKLPYHQPP
jgi:hypothetical protein